MIHTRLKWWVEYKREQGFAVYGRVDSVRKKGLCCFFPVCVRYTHDIDQNIPRSSSLIQYADGCAISTMGNNYTSVRDVVVCIRGLPVTVGP